VLGGDGGREGVEGGRGGVEQLRVASGALRACGSGGDDGAWLRWRLR
jgi:hypothetical protein